VLGQARLREAALLKADEFLKMRFIVMHSPSAGQADFASLIRSQEATAALKSERMVAIFDPKNMALAKLYRSDKDPRVLLACAWVGRFLSLGSRLSGRKPRCQCRPV
jgi:hypothetical protein